MYERSYEEFEGIVEEIIYTNEDNGYTVIEFLTLEKNITAVGIMPYLYEGEALKIIGNFITHNEYGEQFKVEFYEKSVPKTKETILSFLASGIIKGVGAATAKKIVEKFGLKSLEVIEAEPEKLADIKGISYTKALEIGEGYKDKKNVSDIIIFLQKYNISINLAMKINRALGNSPIKQIEDNPYILCDKIDGISFVTADMIAENMGVRKNNLKRIRSGIKYTLQKASLNGHTYLTEDLLIKYSENFLEVNTVEVQNALINLKLDNEVICVEGENPKYFLPFLYLAEKYVSEKLKLLSLVKGKPLFYKNAISDIYKLCKIVLAKNQEDAVKTALNNNITIITGGPGTGKTTIINSIIAISEQKGMKVLLTAPTGRAAKRMSEVCCREAKTIHRLLEVTFSSDGRDKFVKNEENPIKADIIIVDEMSMVDILLFDSLLRAVKIGTRLILVGDINQLPSVGPGNVLKDIINSGLFKCVYLNEIFRQDKESMIVYNAHNILKGEYPSSNFKESDFFIIRKNNSNEIINEIITLVKDRIPNYLSNKNDPSIQVLTPMKKTVLGTINLNKTLQEVLNPQSKRKKEKKWGKYTFREGDRVIQIKNNYEIEWRTSLDEYGIGVFNGDTGVIKKIDNELSTVIVEFYDGKIAQYDSSKLEDLDLSYAITVHKSQGSEFDAVIIPLLYGPQTLLYRNLLYTAITRAKSLVIIVGTFDCIKTMIDNDKETKRFTYLKDMLLKED